MRGQTKIIVGIVSALLLAFFNLTSAFPAEWFNEAIEQDVKQNILNKQVAILPQLNKLDIGFGEHEGIKYYFIKSISPIFFQDKTVRAEIQNVAFDYNAITIELYNDFLGRGSIVYRFREQMIQDITSEQLKTILLTDLANQSHSHVYCDPKTKKFHIHSCNHIPDGAIPMTIETAKSNGYKRCIVCFPRTVYLPDREMELLLGNEMMHYLNYLVLDDKEKEEYLQSIVNQILANWPLKLIGYDYTVKVTRGDYPQSYAAGGVLYISSDHLDAADNMEELEAVLVREVAHVERRHVLRKFLKILSQIYDAQMLAGIGIALGAGAIAEGNRSSGTVLGLASVASLGASIGMAVNIQGHEEGYEREADSLANLYFQVNGKDIGNLLNVLRKNEFNRLLRYKNTDIRRFSSSDPYCERRIHRIENTKFKYFDGPEGFVVNRKKDCPVQLHLKYQELFQENNRLTVYIDDRNFLHLLRNSVPTYENRVVLLVTDKHGEQKFEACESTVVRDTWGYYLTFEQIAPRGVKEFLNETSKASLVIHAKDADETVIDTFHFTKLN